MHALAMRFIQVRGDAQFTLVYEFIIYCQLIFGLYIIAQILKQIAYTTTTKKYKYEKRTKSTLLMKHRKLVSYSFDPEDQDANSEISQFSFQDEGIIGQNSSKSNKQEKENAQDDSEDQLSQSQAQSEELRQHRSSNEQSQKQYLKRLDKIRREVYQKETLKKTIAFCLLRKQKINCEIVKKELKAQYIDIHLNSDKYKGLVESVATDTIRALQRYLEIECGIQVKPLNRNSVQLIARKIINYNDHFDKRYAGILRTFIRYLNQMGEVQLVPREMIALYKKIIELTYQLSSEIYKTHIFQKVKKEKKQIPQIKEKVNSRLKEFEPPQGKITTMDDINRQWTDQYQTFLIKCYKENQDFTQIKCCFSEAYPKKKHLWIAESLKNRFQRTMRRAYHRLKVILQIEGESKKRNLPQLIEMDQRLIKILISRLQPTELRLKFLELLQGRSDFELIQWLILNINAQLRTYKKTIYSYNLKQKKGQNKLLL